MKLNRPAVGFWLGVVVGVVGFFLGGLDDRKHTGTFKIWNTAGNVLFWVGIVVLLISTVRWWVQRSERRTSSVRQQ